MSARYGKLKYFGLFVFPKMLYMPTHTDNMGTWVAKHSI